jgi:hypothetical protein
MTRYKTARDIQNTKYKVQSTKYLRHDCHCLVLKVALAILKTGRIEYLIFILCTLYFVLIQLVSCILYSCFLPFWQYWLKWRKEGC